MSAANWIEVCPIEDIPPLGARVVRTVDCDVAVFKGSDNEIFALKDECPHRQGRLSQGIVHGGIVTCPMHYWKIDLQKGEAVAPDEGCVATYETKTEQGIVYFAKVS
jgi:nitrite reductase (NADH) small subunit